MVLLWSLAADVLNSKPKHVARLSLYEVVCK
jgi:hypothetical protein